MKRTKKLSNEHLLYIAVWLIFLIIPLVTEFIGSLTNHDAHFSWRGMPRVYITLAIFAVTFTVHDLLLAPLIVAGRRIRRYVVGLLILLTCFGALVYTFNFEGRHEHREKMRKEMRHHPEDRPHDPEHKDRPPHDKKRPPRRDFVPMLGGRELMLCGLMIMLLATNVGVKYYFRTIGMRERMRQLERDNLSRQLTYLKYQINPHFFMNTLNSIHALVSIDPEEAERTIEVLSKLMRYVLYDGARPLTPLQKEIDFLRHYIDIMRIRCADRVRIDTDLPDEAPSLAVPPLIFITFVENAFKHGISYEHESFISVSMKVNGMRAEFVCTNSRHAAKRDTKDGGVGLKNVQQRLNLLFHNDYELNIRETDTAYDVRLSLPLQPNPSQP